MNFLDVQSTETSKMFLSKDKVPMLAYGSQNSAWSIALERDHKTEDEDRLECEERLSSSIMFVLKPPEERSYCEDDELEYFSQEVKQRAGGNTKMQALMDIMSRGELPEIRTKRNFTSQDLLAIICPVHLEKLVNNIFDDVRIIAVASVIHRQEIPKADLLNKGGFSSFSHYLQGPDYLVGLKKLMSITNVSKLCTHVMRLATRRDVLRCFPEKLLPKEMLAHYGTDDATVALRRAAAKFGYREDIQHIASCGLELDINGADNKSAQRNALHHATAKKDIPVIRALLTAGAQYDILDAKGLTAKQIASSQSFDITAVNTPDFIKEEDQQLDAKRRGVLPGSDRKASPEDYQAMFQSLLSGYN